ncbi:methyl-accepting chemotaxis protein [Palleronia aestuarii]|uniref:Methyl-accepting chemotaxis protein n=1 Tax=Palleronia aestuarii TaxID=568105 RepID=A0A2W7PPR2_9RHOB|nr:methyl-accepting chemotaxis protein [Palleronia aestuarii]PZX11359.1 methyl-accepting chemotaxis protein [Palleronia aestuarii]
MSWLHADWGRKVIEEREDQVSELDRAIDAHHAVIWFKIDGTILEANERFLSLFGYKANDLSDCSHGNLVLPEEAKGAEYAAFWRELSKGIPQRGVFGRLAKDGSRIWIEASYLPVIDAGTTVTRILLLASEISEAGIVRAEAVSQFEALSSSQAFIEFDLSGAILTANEKFLNLAGCSLTDLTGRHHSHLAVAEETPHFWDRLAKGEILSGEFECRKADGPIRMQVSYMPVRDADGIHYKVIALATDITEDVKAVASLSEGLRALADGDLRIRIPDTVGAKFAALREAIEETALCVGRLVADIHEAADRIAEETDVIASSVQNLSKRNEQQAARVEETSAAMTQMDSTIQSNAENTQAATSRAAEAVGVAENGHGIVREAITSMKEIEESAKNIRQVNEMIDAIAFQTNLLALNAGVEAARAGEAGRGFAVVASEVRALAQRATDAARDINELVQKSHDAVTHGSDLVSRSGEALAEIVTSVSAFADNMRDVSNATSEQAQGISSVRQAIADIDITTQRNAAIAEESAAAATQLAQRGTRLRELVGGFKGGNVHTFPLKAEESEDQGGNVSLFGPRQDSPAAAAGGWTDF